jgi:hypothetical protein
VWTIKVKFQPQIMLIFHVVVEIIKTIYSRDLKTLWDSQISFQANSANQYVWMLKIRNEFLLNQVSSIDPDIVSADEEETVL